MAFEITPIGVIRSPFSNSIGVPIQSRYSDAIGEVILNDEYTDGLKSLEDFSHIILLYWCHRSKPYSLTITPYLDDIEHGLFATRAPSRPNSIGLSIVRVVSIENSKIIIKGLDILNNSPLLDIKPYVPEFDSYPEAISGWLTHKFLKDMKKADQRFQET